MAKKITDQYRVLVSPKIIYLDPLNQLGLHEYMGVRSYSLCSLGRRVLHMPILCIPMQSFSYLYSPIPIPIPQTDIGKDEQWYEYKFRVVVKKGARRR